MRSFSLYNTHIDFYIGVLLGYYYIDCRLHFLYIVCLFLVFMLFIAPCQIMVSENKTEKKIEKKTLIFTVIKIKSTFQWFLPSVKNLIDNLVNMWWPYAELHAL